MQLILHGALIGHHHSLLLLLCGFARFYFEILWGKKTKVLMRSLGKYYLLKLQKEFG